MQAKYNEKTIPDYSVAFQKSLNAVLPEGTSISVDGQIGPVTRAKAALISGQSYNIAKVDNDMGSLFAYPTIISFDLVKAKFDALQDSQLIDRSLPWSMFELALQLENTTSGSFIFTEYEGKYKGLFQFGYDTWCLVMEPSTWKGGKASTSMQLQAMGRLLVANRHYHALQGLDIDFTPEVAYLYHNQGASSAYSFLKTGVLKYPNQSIQAIEVMDLARHKVGYTRVLNRSGSSVIAFLQGRVAAGGSGHMIVGVDPEPEPGSDPDHPVEI